MQSLWNFFQKHIFVLFLNGSVDNMQTLDLSITLKNTVEKLNWLFGCLGAGELWMEQEGEA